MCSSFIFELFAEKYFSPLAEYFVFSDPLRTSGAKSGRRLFPDAEIAEDHVEEVFDIDGAGDAAEAAQRKT